MQIDKRGQELVLAMTLFLLLAGPAKAGEKNLYAFNPLPAADTVQPGAYPRGTLLIECSVYLHSPRRLEGGVRSRN